MKAKRPINKTVVLPWVRYCLPAGIVVIFREFVNLGIYSSMRAALVIVSLIFFTQLRAQAPRLVLPIAHTSMIYDMSFSPDSKKLVTVAGDNTALLWNVQTGELLATLRTHTELIFDCSYSRDGRKILTGSKDSTLAIWNAGTGELVRKFKVGSGMVSLAEFSPDGKTILTVCDDHQRGNYLIYGNQVIDIWDAGSASRVLQLTTPWGKYDDVRFSPDGKYIVASIAIWVGFDVEKKKKIVAWEAATGKLRYEWDGNWFYISEDSRSVVVATAGAALTSYDLSGGAASLISNGTANSKVSYTTFSPDGKWMIRNQDKMTGIYHAGSGKLQANLKIEPDEYFEALFSDDAKTLVIYSGGFSYRVDPGTGQVLDTLSEGTFFRHQLAVSPGGKYIAISPTNEEITIWETSKRRTANRLKGYTAHIDFSVCSPDGKWLATITRENSFVNWTAHIWDLNTGRMTKRIPVNERTVVFAKLSVNGHTLITGAKDEPLVWWDVQSGRKIKSVNLPYFYFSSLDLSPDETTLIMVMNDVVLMYDVGSGALLDTIMVPESEIHHAKFNTSGEYIMVSTDDDRHFLYERSTGKFKFKISGHETGDPGYTESRSSSLHEPVSFSPDGKYFATVSLWDSIKIWRLADGSLVNTMKNNDKYNFYKGWFNNSGDEFSVMDFTNVLGVWDIRSGELKRQIAGHERELQSALYTPDGKKLITTSSDNTAKVWDARTGKLVYTFFPVDGNEYLNLLPDGYYQGSSRAAKLLHYTTSDLRVIAFDQLDVKFNRPDKVLKAIGSTDHSLQDAYYRAYLKRVRKLGIDTSSFRDGISLPDADIVNRDEIPYEPAKAELSLHIRGRDSIFNLERFNIWINGSPVYGRKGLDLKKRNSRELDTLVRVRLSQGLNRIEASVRNQNGTESYRLPLVVNYNPAEWQRESVHFIGIGIDQFADSSYNLRYSVKDIRDLAKNLSEKYKERFHADTLFNQRVTVENLRALKNKLLKTGINDKVIVAYSGHGILSKEFDYYLSTYGINFQDPEKGGMSYEDLEDLLDSIPPRRKLLLIDACHSGEVDKEDLVRLNASPDSLVKGLKPVAYKKEGQLGLQNSFELMQNLFVNVDKNTGATVIAAAGGTQFALEKNELKNGVFTYCILEAMSRHKNISVSALSRIVGDRVAEITNGLQRPVNRNENKEVDWDVW